MADSVAEPDIVMALRFVEKMQEGAWKAVGSSKCAFSIYDALLHVTEYIEGELGICLSEDGGWEDLRSG